LASLISYFCLLWRDDDRSGIAYGIDDPDREETLFSTDDIHMWSTLVLELRDGEPVDYLPNNLGFPICSLKLKRIVDAEKADVDVIQWLPTRVIADGSDLPYFVLHVVDATDVFDEARSIRISSGALVKPCLNGRKIGRKRMLRGEGILTLFVSEHIRQAVLAEECTGMEFQPVELTP
jgi:uncharacterized protein DUF1629